MNTAEMITDRWASLGGTITKSDSGGGGLAGAKVRLVGQGLSLETLTNENGNYSPASLAALGKLIPGDYQVRISRANYARLIDTITLTSLQVARLRSHHESRQFTHICTAMSSMSSATLYRRFGHRLRKVDRPRMSLGFLTWK